MFSVQPNVTDDVSSAPISMRMFRAAQSPISMSFSHAASSAQTSTIGPRSAGNLSWIRRA